MKQRMKEKRNLRGKKEKQKCHHYWEIEVANRPSSLGTCKYCGETREFLNAFPTFNPLRKNGNPLALPKIPDVEIDRGSKS